MENKQNENNHSDGNDGRPRCSYVTITAAEGVILAASVMCMVIQYGPDRAYGLLYLEFLSLYEEGPGITSWIYSVFSISVALIGPFAGFLVDRLQYGTSLIIFTGTLLGTVGYIWTCYASSILEVIIAQGLLIGTAQGMSFTAIISHVNKLLADRPVLSNGVVYSGGSIGAIVFPFLLKELIPVYTIRGTMLIVAGIWFNIALPGILCWYNKPVQQTEEINSSNKNKGEEVIESGRNVQTTELKESSHTNGLDNPGFDKSLESDFENQISPTASREMEIQNMPKNPCLGQLEPFLGRMYISLFFFIFFVSSSQQGLMQYLPAYCEENGISSLDQAAAIAVIGASDLGSRILLSSIGDRIIHHKHKIINTAFICVGIFGVILPFYFTKTTLYAYVIVFGVTSEIGMLFSGHLIAESVGLNNIGKGWGFILTGYGAAGITMASSLGYVGEITGTYYYTLHVVGVLHLLGVFTFYILGGRYKTCRSKSA